MKNFTFLALTTLFLIAFNVTYGQKSASTTTLRQGMSAIPRCGTMEDIDHRMQTDPSFKRFMDQSAQAYTELAKQGPASNQSTARLNTLTGPVFIPVVVHIVLPNPEIISDAAVEYFLNRLNLDFSGLNPDSTNGAPFYGVRGHSLIRFVLAKRDPAGNFTTGIIRKVGTTPIAGGNPQPIKKSSTPTGGSTGWDITQYYNMYVGDGGGSLLGIAPEIGIGGPSGSDNADGVCVDYRVFSNSCFADPSFNLGRTSVHEIGHNFGLYHVFQGGCASNDFQNLTTPGQQYPPALLAAADDTPPQSASTSGCPAVGTLNGCTPAVPKMFQSYMDYTNDACYSMFSKGEVARMEYLLENFRPGYLTTLGGQFPASMPSLDASIASIVSPGGAEFSEVGCTVTSYPAPTCAGNFTPRIKITNLGTATLTSITVSVKVGAAATVTQTVTVNIAPGKSQVVALTPQALIEGSNTITFTTSLPNGGADQNTANDVSATTVVIAGPTALPVTQNFETTLLPTGWSISNPDGDDTWVRAGPGTGGAGAAAAIDNYNGTTAKIGRIDDLKTIRINNTGLLATDSVLITFDVAHKQYPGSFEQLDVLISKDCGLTYTSVFSKIDPALATAGTSTAAYITPAAADWRRERVAIGNNQFGAGPFIVAFRNKSGFGNNVWIDNINVAVKPNKDLVASAILRPTTTECAPPFAPSFTVRNAGGEAVTGFKAGYILNNGTPVISSYNILLAPAGGTTTITFPNITPPAGSNTIKFFVADPLTATPGPDGTIANDTITRTFIVPVIVANIVEGFEGSFLPTNWALINPDNSNTWVKSAPGKASAFSAFIDNYSADFTGQADALQAPPVNTAGADGVSITFDVAHKNYPGSADRLRVLASANCGATFTSVYSKSGTTLATAGATEDNFVNPAQNEWRTETIDLGAAYTGGNVILRFENTSDYGNNIYLDNIRVNPKFKRDLQVVSLSPEVACATAITPTVTVRNVGTEAITSFDIAYTIGAGAPVVRSVTGINLAPNATTTVTLTGGTLVAGGNAIRVYSYTATGASGTGDQFLLNDTLSKTVFLTGIVTSVNETFESATFAPTGWAIANPDNGVTWQRAAIGKNSAGSAAIRNYINYTAGQKDGLYTPSLDYTGADSVKLSFDLSATTRVLADGTTPMDTLEILITRDCGATFTTVYKKSGFELQTLSPVANYNSPTEFAPLGASQWRRETIDLTAFKPNGPLQVVFRNTTNNQNDIYIDNVNLTSRILPANLKAAGYVVAPNPSGGLFNLWYVQAPTNLKFITVMNSAGQVVWKKEYSNNTANVLPIDLTGKAAGVYIVNVGFSDGKDTQIRILKY